MRTGHRPAWRRRPQSPAARIAMPLAIPMALGLTLGAVLAFTGGPSSTTIQQADAGASATPGASGAPGPGASGAPGPGASGAPGPGASGAPSPAPTVSASPAPTATATTPATTAAANVSCDIIVPANPLSAKGLASPYQLTGTDGMSPAASGCQMTNAVNLGAFVQATILNPATGALSVYDPLVVTQGSTPAVTPTAPACRPTQSSRSTSGSTARTCTRSARRPARCGRAIVSTARTDRSSGRSRSATASTSSRPPIRPNGKESWSCRPREPHPRRARPARSRGTST